MNSFQTTLTPNPVHDLLFSPSRCERAAAGLMRGLKTRSPKEPSIAIQLTTDYFADWPAGLQPTDVELLRRGRLSCCSYNYYCMCAHSLF